jgi:hypothetical protein
MNPNLESFLREAIIEQDTQYEIALGKMGLVCKELEQSGVELSPAIRALSDTLGLMIAFVPVSVQPLVHQGVLRRIAKSIEFINKENEE